MLHTGDAEPSWLRAEITTPGNLPPVIPSRLHPLLHDTSPATELGRLFAAAGQRLYLVGGSVRDALLGRDSPDFDFATDARPGGIRSIVSEWADDLYLAGERFGTVGAIKSGEIYEITTFRSEIYNRESRKPTVTFSDTIEDDLARRDFTVNAMAIRLPGAAADVPEMVDPYGGLEDLAAEVLRCPTDPETSFGDDPLRMLRLFRFVSTLGFTPDPEALLAVADMRERLAVVAPERIQVEFDKLMTGEYVGPALWGLVDCGLAVEFVPELPALALEQDPVHKHKDVLAHTIAVVEKTNSERLVVRLAALFHDIGKPATRRFDGGKVTFHHHEVVGARMTRERLRALRYPKQVIEDVSKLVFLHMRPHTYALGWTDSAVRRYVRDASPLVDELNELVRCDVTTGNAKRAKAIQRRIDELEERIEELAKQEEINALRPPIDGHQVIAHLGVEPGPIIGEAMRMLLDRRIDDGPYSEEEAYAMLDEFKAEREL